MGKDFPDGTKLSVIQGKWGEEYKSIRVTEDGEMYILVSALAGVTLIPLQADADGNLFLNIKAQALSEIINRPKYGGALRTAGTKNCPGNATTELFAISGKGMIYGGHLWSFGGGDQSGGEVKYSIDGNVMFQARFDYLFNERYVNPLSHLMIIVRYDTTNNYYSVALSYGHTFEASFKMEYVNVIATNTYVEYNAWYALV